MSKDQLEKQEQEFVLDVVRLRNETGFPRLRIGFWWLRGLGEAFEDVLEVEGFVVLGVVDVNVDEIHDSVGPEKHQRRLPRHR